MRDFFWGGTDVKRKLHWIKWEKVLASRDSGGLEIGSIVSFNLALVLKWRWRFVNGEHSFWVKLISSLYGMDGGFYSTSIRANGDSPWQRLLRVCSKLDETGVLPLSVLARKVGDGKNTRFCLIVGSGIGLYASNFLG